MDLKKRSEELIATIRAMNRCWTEGWNEENSGSTSIPMPLLSSRQLPEGSKGRMHTLPDGGHFVKRLSFMNEERPITRCRSIQEGKVPWSRISSLLRLRQAHRSRPLQGRDMFFLVNEGRKWQVVADQFSPEPIRS